MKNITKETADKLNHLTHIIQTLGNLHPQLTEQKLISEISKVQITAIKEIGSILKINNDNE